VLCTIAGTVWGDDANWKEIGAIWQIHYENAGCELTDLPGTDQFCANLKNVLVNKGKWAVSSNVWEGDTAFASDIENTGNDKGDWVDLFVFNGHTNDAIGSDALHFRSNHDPLEMGDGCNVTHDECRWGEGDCEFVIAHTCEFLSDYGSPTTLLKIKKMCQGVHVICGASSDMYTSPHQGTVLGIYLMGKRGWNVIDVSPKTVKSAWFESCQEDQEDGVVASVVCHTSCENDYMPGNLDWANGKGMANDPPPCTDGNQNDYIKRSYVVSK
jgi:hypothetical protein